MKKTYKFTNLCCANCAAKIERQAAALPGVESCTLNFMFLKMAVTAPDERFPALDEEIKAVVKRIEPDCEVK